MEKIIKELNEIFEKADGRALRITSIPNENHKPACNDNRYIVAGFPGTGKSYAGSQFPDEFIDMESSDYHWRIQYGTVTKKELDPNWPNNYLDVIEGTYRNAELTGTILCICCSTHAEVLKGLKDRGLHFIAICPKDKEETIRRYKERGNDEAFIENLNKNFNNFRNDVLNSPADMVICTDKYISDVMSYFAHC